MVAAGWRVDWRQVAADPDIYADLGYELLDLEVIDLEATDEMIVMPEEAEMLHDDAFIVVSGNDVCDLGERA